MIPRKIKRSHVLRALREIDELGVPAGRKSQRYQLVHSGREYPPKYVVSLANYYVDGTMLASSVFGGGQETNGFLRRLGFEIEPGPGSAQRPVSRTWTPRSPSVRHTERCPDCKATVARLLETIYGDVAIGHRFDVGPLPGDFEESPWESALQGIFTALGAHRGHRDFVRAQSLPPVDFYVPDPGFIVEFDESQHFTTPRRISLQAYPPEMKLGFDRERWIRLCGRIRARDNDPPYRDEQRAWYDSLRDFLPSLLDIGPTVRLYAKDLKWCDLDERGEGDLAFFRSLLEGVRPAWKVDLREDPGASLARIVIAGPWAGEVEIARTLLADVMDSWPKRAKVDCLLTCGAFLTFDWPESLGRIPNRRFPPREVIETLISEAQAECEALLRDGVRERLATQTDYLTIGVDSYKDRISLSNVSIRTPHAELVGLVDLANGTYFWTGKSYPTSGQEEGLVRFEDVNSHFRRLRFGRAMILGCHDLTVFNPRGKAVTKQPWRKEVRLRFYRAVQKEAPTVVLHHPHTTDSPLTWTSSWNELSRSAPTVQRYLGAGRYHDPEGNGVRAPIETVLQGTKRGPTVDVIVSTIA